jgi:hypothetical protein
MMMRIHHCCKILKQKDVCFNVLVVEIVWIIDVVMAETTRRMVGIRVDMEPLAVALHNRVNMCILAIFACFASTGYKVDTSTNVFNNAFIVG